MNEMISILHISDLHRNKIGKVDNTALMNSLIQDHKLYTSKNGITSPNIIIVSGDIIYGSNQDTFDDAIVEIEEQYKEAEFFLNDLANYFLEGDKNRIILVPGNHDVATPYVFKSLVEVDHSKYSTEKLKLLVSSFFNETSYTRWSWKKLKFYEITNHSDYNERFKNFMSFFNRFYNGIQTYSLNPDDQFNIFEIDSLGITICAYNSCFNNDILNTVGMINPNCIAKSYPYIQKSIKKGHIILGSWHHNVKGSPKESNYMDISILKNLINYGINIGFHGHQHKIEKIDEYFDIHSDKKITLVSAGTLSSGPHQLPTGESRQYNIIEIDRSTCKAKLHPRKMMNSVSFSIPIWEQDNNNGFTNGYIDFLIEKPSAPNINHLLSDASDLIGEKKYVLAIEKLEQMDTQQIEVKTFLGECYIETEEYKKVISLINNPTSEREAIFLLQAVYREKDIEKAKSILQNQYIQNLQTPFIKDLKSKVSFLLKD